MTQETKKRLSNELIQNAEDMIAKLRKMQSEEDASFVVVNFSGMPFRFIYDENGIVTEARLALGFKDCSRFENTKAAEESARRLSYRYQDGAGRPSRVLTFSAAVDLMIEGQQKCIETLKQYMANHE